MTRSPGFYTATREDLQTIQRDQARKAAAFRDQVYIVLAEAPAPLTADEITLSTGFDRTAVGAALIRMTDSGRITTTDAGGSRRWTTPGFGES